MPVSTLLKESLTREARALGFDCIGVTIRRNRAGRKTFPRIPRHRRHGDMDWLAASPERRADPRVLWPGVRSVIMLGVNYGPDEKSAGDS